MMRLSLSAGLSSLRMKVRSHLLPCVPASKSSLARLSPQVPPSESLGFVQCTLPTPSLHRTSLLASQGLLSPVPLGPHPASSALRLPCTFSFPGHRLAISLSCICCCTRQSAWQSGGTFHSCLPGKISFCSSLSSSVKYFVLQLCGLI